MSKDVVSLLTFILFQITMLLLQGVMDVVYTPQQDIVFDEYVYQVNQGLEVFVYFTTDLKNQINYFQIHHDDYVIVDTNVVVEKNLIIIVQKRKNE